MDPLSAISVVERRNFRLHVAEGILFIGSSTFISLQTTLPLLIRTLGGSNVVIGALPVVSFMALFLPQIISAHYLSRFRFRKQFVLVGGLMHRFLLPAIGVCLLIIGTRRPSAALFFFFVLLGFNQILIGITTPAWYDFVAKTVDPAKRGRLMGIRSSLGAGLAFANGFVLVFLLSRLQYPANFASIFGAAFAFQFASYLVQRRVDERNESAVSTRLSLGEFIRSLPPFLERNRTLRQFLFASTFLLVGLVPMGFFLVAAFARFHPPDSYVGYLTAAAVGSQVVLGALVGFVADRWGSKASLLCSASLFACATVVALFSTSIFSYVIVFILIGANISAEMLIRYNFAADCSTPEDRPVSIGIMNFWLAPLYLVYILAGWWSDAHGYASLFGVCLVFSIVGIVLLARVPDPRKLRLALSSK